MDGNNTLWLTAQLPPIEPIVLRGEPDYYGASYEIAMQLGRAKPPRSFATWRHGWVYQPIIDARQLVLWGGPQDHHLVATEAHVEMLRRFGFERAVAVGLPFVYTPNIVVERQPNTLLVMPSHSLPYTSHNWDERSYVAEIAQLKPHFSQIVACVHSACVAKGIWVTEFERQGIPWITGATVEDRNALRRMTTIFQSFEAMTTNTIGSHLAYAAYCGCRVSIYGPFAEFSERDFENDPWYKLHPEIMKHVIIHGREAAIREQYPQFFVSPQEAETHKAWGSEALGVSYKRPPKELGTLLGWETGTQVVGHLKRAINHLKRQTTLFRGLKPF